METPKWRLKPNLLSKSKLSSNCDLGLQYIHNNFDTWPKMVLGKLAHKLIASGSERLFQTPFIIFWRSSVSRKSKGGGGERMDSIGMH